MGDFLCEERLLIDGELVAATGGRTYENVNPATEAVSGVAADASPGDIDRAIAAARRAFDETDWSRDHALRARCIRQLQEAFQNNMEEIRRSYIAEVGCPLSVTYGPGLDEPVKSLAYYADFLEKYEWAEDLGLGEAFGMKAHRWIEREPVGVVGAITAWNFPHELNLKKACWALAAGCTVVLKSAPVTPWCALLLGRFIHENTDMPPGVINVITSSDNGIGEQITVDPRVDMISFTGSTAVGRRILAVTAPFVKRTALELGGKSALVLLDDLPATAIPAIAGQAGSTICSHSGQGCAHLSRILVPKQYLAESAEALKAAMANVVVGDPTDPKTVQGPQCSAAQRERVLALIQKGIDEGSKLVCGGGRPKHLPKGYYVEPTVFIAESGDTVAQQEFFGPVQCLIGYEDEADAVRIANDSIYGLSGGVLSADLERGKRFARRIRTGTMMINGGIWYGPEVPFGGYKCSGLGRENGRAGFEEFLEIKALAEPAA
jgi:aldehyde dehydrogenase (NAD+)